MGRYPDWKGAASVLLGRLHSPLICLCYSSSLEKQFIDFIDLDFYIYEKGLYWELGLNILLTS